MDTSKEYIDILIKALEIQNEWHIDAGDFICQPPMQDILVINNQDVIYFLSQHNTRRGRYQWLPKQDQLQDMLTMNEDDKHAKARSLQLWFQLFSDWAEGQFFLLSTLEQMWLVFVMRHKFNKHWNGENFEVIQ